MERLPLDPEARKSRRQHVRQRSLLACRIVYGVCDIVVEGTIRDLSPEGARIKLPTLLLLPHQFRLIIGQDGACFEVEVSWRRGQELGVRFVETIDVKASRDASVALLRRLGAEMADRRS